MIQDPPAVDHRAGSVLACPLRGGNFTELLPWRRQYYDVGLRNALLRGSCAANSFILAECARGIGGRVIHNHGNVRRRSSCASNSPKASSTTSMSGLYVSPRMPIAPYLHRR